MNHATKMILVPHELAPTGSKSTDKFLSSLDEEMQKILLDQTLPTDVKIIKYNQILQQFQKTFREQTKPYQLEVKDMPVESPQAPLPQPLLSPTTPKDDSSSSDKLLSPLLDLVSKKAKKNAEILLSYVRQNPNIKISDNNEIIINNNKIEHSNILSLIRDLTKDNRTKMDPPIGSGPFLKALVGSNIPRDLVNNTKRFDLLKETELYATPGESSDSDSTPKTKKSWWRDMK